MSLLVGFDNSRQSGQSARVIHICRFQTLDDLAEPRIGILKGKHTILPIPGSENMMLADLLDSGEAAQSMLAAWLEVPHTETLDLQEIQLLPPVDMQEVWAAGVTYLRSKKARMEESEHSASAYDQVYDAERPEIFFKSMPHKVCGQGDPVGIRTDSQWNVPEPEVALWINRNREIVGYTIGNDMSSRDIEGENTLYLPQAKVYDNSCALGPWITLGLTPEEAANLDVRLDISRDGKSVFSGESSTSNMKRSFDELRDFLCRCQNFTDGAVLLTGTGIVPDDTFSLQENDVVSISVKHLGTLENPVVEIS